MSEQRKFAIIVEEGEHNYSAYSPDLPGCVSTGKTVEETVENMKEAISLHLEGLKEDSRPIPESATVATQLITISV
ncbi:MAG: type II toxin-antitoxin system HicB family antitoxin [Spirochaetota bacterium]